MEEVHEGAVGEGRQSEGHQQNSEADDAQDETATAQSGFAWNLWVAHGGDEQEESPENPAHPVEDAGNEQNKRQADGKGGGDSVWSRRAVIAGLR